MRFIWASRGEQWGFRFLIDGGMSDPLAVYEAAFSAVGDDHEVLKRSKDFVALRFDDPLNRRDHAGRVIPHDFVLFINPKLVSSVGEARQMVWPEVSERFASIWTSREPPRP